MTATEAVVAQLNRILATKNPLKAGQEDAAQAEVIFAGLEKNVDFKLMALAHAKLSQLDPVRIAISLVYIGYMAAKMEGSDVISTN